MADHSKSPPNNIPGIGGICKAYKSVFSRRQHDKNSCHHRVETENKFKSMDDVAYIDEANKVLNEEKTMNGEHDYRFNGDGFSSPRIFIKHRSVDNFFTSIPSPLSSSTSPSPRESLAALSISASRRSTTPTPSAAATPRGSSKSGRSSPTPTPSAAATPRGSSKSGRSSPTPTPNATSALLKNMSRRSMDTAGEALLKNMSRRSMDTAVSPAASLSRSVSRMSPTTPIMFSNSNGFMKAPTVEKKLECTLEELCFGCVKKIKITRDVITDHGETIQEEEKLTINVKPGWKKGTKITFEGMGNETPGILPADITFVISEKRHPLYRRKGDDLELIVEMPLVKALTGCSVPVPLLGGEKMSLSMNDIIYPGYEKLIAGQGMPKPKEQGKRGNLIISFIVEFPTDLTQEQRSEAFSILQDAC